MNARSWCIETPNSKSWSYSFVFGLMGIRRITEVKLLCQTVWDSVTAFLTRESADFREVWMRTKFRRSLSPSLLARLAKPRLPSEQGVVGWSLTKPCLGSQSGRGTAGDSLSLSHLCLVVCVTSFTSSFPVSISLAGWDLVAFLKEKVYRVPVLPLV